MTNFLALRAKPNRQFLERFRGFCRKTRIFVTKNRIFQKSATYVQKPTLTGRPDEGQIASILSAFTRIPKVATISKNLFFERAQRISSLLRVHHLSPHLLRDV